jgi:hypothetical protein
MESTEAGPNGSPRKGLRERLKASEPVGLPPETLERLSNLPVGLSETARTIADGLEETADRIAWRLQGTATEVIERHERLAGEMNKRLTEQRRALEETERNLAYTEERLRRLVDRKGWIQTGVLVLALIAGGLGGTAAALVILWWLG